MATLEQLRTTWSILDVIDANEVLDAIDAARAAAQKPLPPKP